MGLKSSETTLESTRTVPEIGRALQGALAQVKAQSIDEITSNSGALSGFDDRASIEIVAGGQTLMSGQWAVQVYVYDHGHLREIRLIALGDGGFTRAWNGAANTASLSTSIKKRDAIAASLQ